MTTRKITQPPNGGLLNPGFAYVSSDKTNIADTFDRARRAIGPVKTVKVPFSHLPGMGLKGRA